MEILNTSSVAPARRFDMWREVVSSTCGDVRVQRQRNDAFDGAIVTGDLGTVRASLVSADPHYVDRTRPKVSSCGGESLYVCRVLRGEVRVVQDGREAGAGPGDLISFDSARAYSLGMREPFSMVALMFPHHLVGLTPGITGSLTATRWFGVEGVGALLSEMVAGVGRHMTELDAATAAQLGGIVAGLVGAMFAERLRHGGADPVQVRQALLMRVQAFAREHLGDTELDPAMLARRHNISIRYLQKLFQEQGTSPASWIRDERLARCHADLKDPRLANLTVAMIGERAGLTGASHFSRLFRERYGLTPQEFRKGSCPKRHTLRSIGLPSIMMG